MLHSNFERFLLLGMSNKIRFLLAYRFQKRKLSCHCIWLHFPESAWTAATWSDRWDMQQCNANSAVKWNQMYCNVVHCSGMQRNQMFYWFGYMLECGFVWKWRTLICVHTCMRCDRDLCDVMCCIYIYICVCLSVCLYLSVFLCDSLGLHSLYKIFGPAVDGNPFFCQVVMSSSSMPLDPWQS